MAETMEDLLRALDRVNRMGSSSKVIGTLATRRFHELPTSQRAVVTQYMNSAMASSMDLSSLTPEQPSSLAFQTDWWWLQRRDSNYAGLVSYIQRAALTTR